MKILITGGAGFIGTEIVRQLHNSTDNCITVLDSMTQQIHGEDWQDSYLFQSIKDKCHFIKGDIRNLSDISDALDENEVIVHLVAETGTGQSMYEINKYNEVNIMGTSNLLQAISNRGKKSRIRKIILASSRSIYGEGRYECPHCGVIYPAHRERKRLDAGDFGFYCSTCGSRLKILATTEDSEINPQSLYAYTKYAQEMMLKTMCPAFGIDYTIFRFQNVYGAGQSLKNPYTGILSVFSTLMLKNKAVNIFEDGKESRDFIHVKDIAKGVIAALDCAETDGEVINLGSRVNTSVMEIANLLKKYYGSESDLKITGDFRIGDIGHNRADISKAKRLIDFVPDISLEEGLKDFCKWVLSQECDNSGYEQSLCEMEKAGMLIRNRKG